MTESHEARRLNQVAAVLAGVVAAAEGRVRVQARGLRELVDPVIAELRRLLGVRGGALVWGAVDPDVVIDCGAPGRPVVRYVRPPLPWSHRSRLRETQAYFAARAGTWDARVGDDLPAYRAAVIQAGFRTGGRVADVGCGTGPALPALRAAVGPGGVVLGIDLTAEMLLVARRHGRERDAVLQQADAALLQADAGALPLPDAALDGILAAGLVWHLPDPASGLAELARVTRDGGRLALFHPSGREAPAARYGPVPDPDDPLGPGTLGPLLAATGWRLDRYDDAPDRFLALASRITVSASA